MAVALRLGLAGASLVLLTAIVEVQAPGISILQDRAFNRSMVENALDQGLVDEPMLTSMDEFPAQLARSRRSCAAATSRSSPAGMPTCSAGP